MGNRLALRIAIFGGLAVVLFAILFFRLWRLQVLDGEQYLAEAKNNRTREYRVSAPRGEILDRNGELLVGNRTSLALQVNPRKLPEDPAQRRAELARLANLTHSTLRRVRRTMHEELKLAPAAPVTLRRDIGRYLVYYLQENQDRFPGVEVQRVFVRDYPNGTLAAHIVGNVGEISEEELKEARYRGLQPGDEIGQDGVEDTYDRFLRGEPGLTRIQVDALGQPTPNGRLVSKPPLPGESLKLSIDADVQAAGEAGLAAYGSGGFVTMDVNTGEILGLGSSPTFEPLTPPLTQKQVDDTYRNPAAPLVDRAISGLYPTGSTFKLITALAALEEGAIGPTDVVVDGGSITVGGLPFQNAGGVALGPVDMVRALEVSSDVYFYLLGQEMWDTGGLQRWAHKLGIGRQTGIDLPGAEEGLLPSQRWRNQLYEEGGTERPWSVGDNIQLATGQGDLQANPLQMAVAYATLGNGGTVVTPHVGKEVTDAAGRVLVEFDPPAAAPAEDRPRVPVPSSSKACTTQRRSPGGTSYEWSSATSRSRLPARPAPRSGTARRTSPGT